MKKRIKSLDWLRGLMAISIMVYHLTYWHLHPLDSSGLLGRLGIYGVSIFFILSGLSIALVYSGYIKDMKTSFLFYTRRIFRIWPLLWVCIFLAIIPPVNQPYDTLKILGNLTTAFGFLDPGAYINTGAWSIGNEMVYYAMTPFIIFLYNKNMTYGNLFAFTSFLVTCIFAFFFLGRDETLGIQWQTYINPFNNLFLYTSGIAIFYNLQRVSIKPFFNLLLFVLSTLFFIFYPVTGDTINIVTGMNRLFFIIASIVLVISCFKFDLYQFVPNFISGLLEKFGIATYGIYLLHPIISSYLVFWLYKIGLDSKYLLLASTYILTTTVALISYNFYEKKMMSFGKNITQHISNY